MKLDDLLKNVSCTVCVSIVVVFTFWILDLPVALTIPFAILVGMIAFTLCKYMMFNEDDIRIERKYASKYPNVVLLRLFRDKSLLVLITYMACLIIVVSVPSINSGLFIDWTNIPFASWLRLVAAFLLSCFLPGFAILQIVKREYIFNKIETVFFSYLISSLFSIIIFYSASFFITWPSSPLREKMALVLSNLGLLLAFFLKRMGRNSKSTPISTVHTSKRSMYRGLIIACVLALVLIGQITVALNDYPMMSGDQWRGSGQALRFYDGEAEKPDFESLYFYKLFIASLFSLSGIPSINAFLSLVLLNAMPYLAYYVMTMTFFEKERSKIPVLATVLMLFLGFGWIYFLHLRGVESQVNLSMIYAASGKTYDMYRFETPFFPNFISHLWLFGIPTFLGLAYLIFNSRLPKITQFLLILTTTVLGYLTHTAEVIFFLICFSVYILIGFFTRAGIELRIKEVVFSITLGMLIVILLDLCAPYQWFTRAPSLIVFTAISTIFPSIVLAIAKLRKFLTIRFTVPAQRILKILFGSLLVYLFFLCIIIYYHVFPDFSALTFTLLFTSPVPFYIYPIKFGVIGALSLVGIIYILSNASNLKALSFFLTIGFTTVIVVFFTRVFSSDLWVGLFSEARMTTFLLITGSAFSALILARLFRQISKKAIFLQGQIKKLRSKPMIKVFLIHVGMGLFLAMIVIGGIGSRLLSIEGWNQFATQVSKQEMEGARFIACTLDANSTVLTVSDYLSRQLLFLAGLGSNQILGEEQYVSNFFRPGKPETVYYNLAKSKVQYIFLRKPQDFSSIDANFQCGFLRKLLKYLPVVRDNPHLTIYRLPPISFPDRNSNFAMVMPTETIFYNASQNGTTDELAYSSVSFLPLSMLTLSQLRFTVFPPDHSSLFNVSLLMLPCDGSVVDTQEFLHWVNGGGRLVILNSENLGVFAKIMNIDSDNRTEIANGLTNKNFNAEIPSIRIRRTYSPDESTEIIANYTRDGSIICPYAFRKQIGDGEIYYLHSIPYFSTLLNSSDEDRRRMFLSLPSLIRILDLQGLSTSVEEQSRNYVDYAIGDVRLSGKVRVESKSLYFSREELLQVDFLDLSQAEYSATKITEDKLCNLSLKEVRIIGDVFVKVVTENPEMHSSMSSMDIDFTLTNRTYISILINQNGSASITCLEPKGDNCIYLEKGTISMTVSPSQSIRIRNPLVMFQGELFFDRLYYHDLEKPWAEQNKRVGSFQINGSSIFNLKFVDDNITILSIIDSEGEIRQEKYRTYQGENEEIEIPWRIVMSSNWNILLSILIVGLTLIRIKRVKQSN